MTTEICLYLSGRDEVILPPRCPGVLPIHRQEALLEGEWGEGCEGMSGGGGGGWRGGGERVNRVSDLYSQVTFLSPAYTKTVKGEE